MGRSPFAGIENEEIGGPREPFLAPNNVRRDLALPKEKNIVSSDPAWYDLRIDECEFMSTRKKADAFKVKFTVVDGDGPNAIGTIAAWMVMASSDGFKRDTKTFVCTAMNYNPELLRESDMEAVVSRQQPLTAGRRFVRVLVENTKTKERQNDFTKHSWIPRECTGFDAAGKPMLIAPQIDQVAEYIKRKGQIK